MKIKSDKLRKSRKITDDMVGEADKICACSAVVGEIILATNEAEKKKVSLRDTVESIKEIEQNISDSGTD